MTRLVRHMTRPANECRFRDLVVDRSRTRRAPTPQVVALHDGGRVQVLRDLADVCQKATDGAHILLRTTRHVNQYLTRCKSKLYTAYVRKPRLLRIAKMSYHWSAGGAQRRRDCLSGRRHRFLARKPERGVSPQPPPSRKGFFSGLPSQGMCPQTAMSGAALSAAEGFPPEANLPSRHAFITGGFASLSSANSGCHVRSAIGPAS